MTDDDKATFSDSMAALGIAFGQAITPPVLQAYWQFLRDLEAEDFRRAVTAAGRTLKWLPKPAELRDLAGAGSKADALIAWDAVRGALRKFGYTHNVDFGPLVNATVRSMGGWRALDDMPTAQLDVWGKKEFERVYDLLAVKDPASLNGGPLRGAFDGVPVRVAIVGVTPPLQLPSAEQAGTNSHVRQLADSKSVTP